MDVNSLPKTVTRQRRGCDLNPGPSAPEWVLRSASHRLLRKGATAPTPLPPELRHYV